MILKCNQKTGMVNTPIEKTKNETITTVLVNLVKYNLFIKKSHRVPIKPPTIKTVPNKPLPITERGLIEGNLSISK